MPELKLYTVAEIREWLVNNHAVEGLSEQVIAPTRAWAIIHNPYVKEDDVIVAAIFEDGQLAAYTASFPDILDGKRVWWASTLYCYPQFAGRGYGMIVVGSLMEAHEPDLTYDRWAAKETVEIFNHFGYNTTYTSRYHLSDGKIDTSSLKGKLAYCAQELKKCLHPWQKPSKADYTIQYVPTIDDEAYAFMQTHRDKDLWLREQEMLNWIVSYPFVKAGKKETECIFGANAKVYEHKVVTAYSQGQLIGVYVLRVTDNTMAVVYIYYAEERKDIVYASITDQIIAIKPKEFVTEDKALCAYVREHIYYPKEREEKVSLSLPKNVLISQTISMQLGDGDSFA